MVQSHNLSIHPRVLNGRTRYEKVNTHKHPSAAKRNRIIASMSEHLERHPHDNATREHLKKITE